MATLFADIILPLSLPRPYTYSVPAELSSLAEVGKRVVVQLGKQKMYAGLIYKIHQVSPVNYEVKPIVSVLDDKPIITQVQMKHWEWIASYYMSNLGEVMIAALPSGLKLQSETRIVLNESYDHSHEHLADDEYLLYEALLGRSHLTPDEAAKILHRKSAHQVLKSMIEKGVVLMEEELREKYKPKKEQLLSLASIYSDDEETLKSLFESLEKRSPRQLEALMAFLKIFYEARKDNRVLKSEVLKSAASAAINALIKKGVLLEKIIFMDRLASGKEEGSPLAELNDSQLNALEDIKTGFQDHDVTLLHGVTSSGKTEIYLHLIREMMDAGKQVIFLMPEIALTAQMINRLRKVLGDKVDVYHSRFSLNERVEVWKRVLNNDPRSQVILGARSSMFLPYSKLGLVIIDEEHDSSYKQVDPAPRYNARDAVILLAKMHGAKTLMGTATPSMESYYNALAGKFGLVKISERYGGMLLPEIRLVDTKEAARKKIMKSHFSPDLLEAMQLALDNKEQVILFQNRRGFAPILECNQCAWTPHCKNCSVTLTYHKQYNLLKCHYCGYSSNLPSMCDACGSHRLTLRGVGTEKIEDEMQVFFPKASIARLDLDAARSRNAYVQVLSNFEDRKIDILVGTQMITKGLDFDNVSLVGIINADQLLNFPDFRAFERSFQLLQQVSGRSGRKFKRGKVIIQTHQPKHWVLTDVMNNDYEKWYMSELEERLHFQYPPHQRLIELNVKHRQQVNAVEGADQLASMLKKLLGQRVYGPHDPLVQRVRNYWLKTILIRVEKEASTIKIKEILQEAFNEFYSIKENRSILIQPDVDPL